MSGIWKQLSWVVLAQGVSRGCSHVKAQLGLKNLLPSSLTQFLPCLCFSLARSLSSQPHSPVHEAVHNMATNLPQTQRFKTGHEAGADKGEVPRRKCKVTLMRPPPAQVLKECSEQSCSLFYSLLLERIYHLFYHMLIWGECTRVWIPGVGDYWWSSWMLATTEVFQLSGHTHASSRVHYVSF